MERGDVIDKVRALWRLADHPNTGEHERANAVARAEDLMAKYQIEEIVLHEREGHREDIVMLDIRVTEDGQRVLVKDQRVGLVNVIAIHNRCRGIVTSRHETVDSDTRRVIPGGTFFRVIGYKSDAEFVRLFCTNLGIDMMMALFDEPSSNANYQREFCEGYVQRIDVRLRSIKRAVDNLASSTGMEIVLANKSDLIDKYVEQQFPKLGSYRESRGGHHDANARARGSAAADRADLGQSKVGEGSRRELA